MYSSIKAAIMQSLTDFASSSTASKKMLANIPTFAELENKSIASPKYNLTQLPISFFQWPCGLKI